MIWHCNKCGKKTAEYLFTAYGDTLCEDCWDEYICTYEGKVEYLIGICNNDYPATEFDDEFLRSVVASWNANKELVRPHISKRLYQRCKIRAEVLAKL